MNPMPLLATKLQIPARRPASVDRGRLLTLLDGGLALGHRLTMVSAPPGFGKTTLIRTWIDQVKRPTAWLTLDANDNTPERFMDYLIAALAAADERIGEAMPLDGSEPDPRNQMVLLINAIANAQEPLLLVLDDYHAMRDLIIHDLVGLLLEHQPVNLHFVIATREDPPLPLSRLRARNQLTDVRQRGLRFSLEEAAQFLRQTMSLDLSAPSIQALTSRAEGWITGLQLAGLAMQQHDDVERFVADFSGDDRYIVDYLMAEVLNSVPEDMRQFMRQTSVLDRLSAPLCNALTGRDDAQQMLEQLDRANMFLVALDTRREWYRYHALLADVLRLSLGREEQAELSERAKAWYAEQNLQGAEAFEVARVSSGPVQGLIEPLSARELEVLALIAEGLSNAEMAQWLYIALGTVKRHINNIYGKLDCKSRTQAIALATKLGILMPTGV